MRAGFEQNAVGVVIAKVIQAGGLGGVGKVDAGCRAGFGNFTAGDGDFVVEGVCAKALQQNTVFSGFTNDELVEIDPVDSLCLDAVERGLIAIQGQEIHGGIAGAVGDFDQAGGGGGVGSGDRCVGGTGQAHFGSKSEWIGRDLIGRSRFEVDDQKTRGVVSPCVIDVHLQGGEGAGSIIDRGYDFPATLLNEIRRIWRGRVEEKWCGFRFGLKKNRGKQAREDQWKELARNNPVFHL